MVESSTSEEQRFYLMRMIKDQQDKLKKKSPARHSRIFNPLSHFLPLDINQRKKASRR